MNSLLKKLQNNRTLIYGGLLLILLFGIVLRLKYFVGLNNCDDMAYSHFAARLIYHGEWFRGDNAGIKIGVWYPIAFFYKLLGVSHFSLGLYPLLCSLANIILIFFIGLTLFNPLTGLIASFLLSLYPLDVIYATWATPDVPLSFFQAFAAFLIIYQPSDKKTNIRLKLLAGLIWGGSSLINASSNVFLFGIIGIYLASFILKTKKIPTAFAQEIISLLAGYIIVLIGEGLFFAKFTGNILYKFSETLSHYSGAQGVSFGRVDFMLYPKAMFLLNWVDRGLWEYGLYFYLFILAMVFFIVRRKAEDKQVMIPIFWALFYFIYLQFGSMSLARYIAMHRLPRHLSVLSVPIILTGSFFLERLLHNGRLKKLVFLLLTVLLIGSSFLFINNRFHGLLNYRETNNLMVQKLTRLGADQRAFFFVHGSLGSYLDLFGKYKDYPYQAWGDIDQCPDFNLIYFLLKYKHIYFIMKDDNLYQVLARLKAADLMVKPLETVRLDQNYYIYYTELK